MTTTHHLLRRRYLIEWVFYAVAAVLVVALAAHGLLRERAGIERLEGERLQVQARVVSANLLQQFAGVDRALLGVRDDFFSGNKSQGVSVLKSRRLKALTEAVPGLKVMLVLDAQGVVVAAHNSGLVGKSFADREYFTTPRQRLDRDTLYISRPFKARNGVWTLSFTRALTDEQGRFAGVVMASLAQDYFSVLLNSVLSTDDMRSTLVHGDGILFMNAPFNPKTFGSDLTGPGTFFTRHRESGRADTLLTGHVRVIDQDRMIATRTISQPGLKIDRPLVIHVSRELGPMYAAWRFEALRLSGLLLALMVGGAVAIWILQRRRREFEALWVQTQREREAASRRIRTITDNLPAMVAYVDAGLIYRFANARTETLMGVLPESMVGMHVVDSVSPAIYAELLPYIEGVLSGEAQHFERHRTESGDDRHLTLDYIPDLDAAGEVQGFYVMVTDITARKQAELRQAASEARVKSILTHAPDAFISIDGGSTITEWNRSAELTFGWARDEVMGRQLAEVLIPPQHRAGHNNGMRLFAHTGTGAVVNKRLEMLALHKSGRMVPVELSVAAVPAGDGAGFAAIAFLHDITERRMAQDAIRASEKLLRDITDNIPAHIAYCDADERCVFVNTPARQLLKLDSANLRQQTLRTALGEKSYALHEAAVKKALAGKRSSFEAPSLHFPDAYFQAHLVPDLAEDGTVRGFYAMTLDITGIKRAELRRAESEKLVRAVTDNLPIMISYIDAQERLRFLNATFEQWTGIDIVKAIGQPLQEVVGPELYAQRREALHRSLAGERVEFELESVSRGVERCLHNVYMPDVGEDGRVAGIFTLSSDTTALKRVERQLQALARVDTLTGLPNRHQFNEKLAEALARAQRSGLGVGLMFLDVDHFKRINDSLGHAAGDAVLQEFALRLQMSVRDTDCVARLAGDEFVVVLEGLHAASELEQVARKILALIGREFSINGRAVPLSTSIGVALHAHGTVSPPDFLAQADRALYEAKAAGRNTYRLAVPAG